MGTKLSLGIANFVTETPNFTKPHQEGTLLEATVTCLNGDIIPDTESKWGQEKPTACERPNGHSSGYQ
jgi:hypothetical protein